MARLETCPRRVINYARDPQCRHLLLRRQRSPASGSHARGPSSALRAVRDVGSGRNFCTLGSCRKMCDAGPIQNQNWTPSTPWSAFAL